MAVQRPCSFRKLIALKHVETDTFQSIEPAWPPGVPDQMQVKAFGGHVYAQAAWAASQTVASDMTIHNVSGNFLLPGDIDIPFVYHVRRVRDGGIYCLRAVEVFQNSDAAAAGRVPCFVSTVSFKRKEKKGKTIDYMHQSMSNDHITKEYACVLAGKEVVDHPLAPAADSDWWEGDRLREIECHADAFPGLEMRKVGMLAYNRAAQRGGEINGESVSRWRQLLFYRMRQDEVTHQDEKNLNLHACAHMYASDRNGLFILPRALGHDTTHGHMGSLSHTVIFHGSPNRWNMLNEDETAKWFVQESWTSNSGDNRVCHNSRLWDHTAGIVIGTTLQDGMVRLWKQTSDSKI